MSIKALIVEDSRLARQELRHLLKDLPQVEVVGEAQDAPEARQLVASLRPDLMFLDIQLPGEDGFALLESLDYVPEVIFTTAYDAYALKAFEVNALDYLQKPIQPDRLAAALTKLPEKPTETGPPEVLGLHDKVFVRDGDRCWFVPLADIRLFEVDNNYTRIYFGEHRPMIPRTLNYMETRLDSRTFFRASRKHIVNIHWIDRIEPWFSHTLKLYLRTESAATPSEAIEVSRRQSSRFRDLMSF
ncbi:two-component system, LytT family, response regulator [Catalinimonas alkaloidigena]|uniref:Two-component system, LytT family, response regulator n=1 Tax=Catalinimonas alkaloidigena TaxID=1075417 RepID=A0A1G9T7U8_9BACT|nr:LytTR family DNA-binding domain-containing protein [Catalinimonas alkaloidigena]SDM43819.1 two-component system, LytT family, response regulator [Catalinimonas alkaloidigena]